MIAIRGMVIDGFVVAWQQTFPGRRAVTSLFDEIATESTYSTRQKILMSFHLALTFSPN